MLSCATGGWCGANAASLRFCASRASPSGRVRRVRHEVAAIEAPAALVFAQRRVQVNGRHANYKNARHRPRSLQTSGVCQVLRLVRNHSTVRRRPSSRPMSRAPAEQSRGLVDVDLDLLLERPDRDGPEDRGALIGPDDLDEHVHDLAHRWSGSPQPMSIVRPSTPGAVAAATYARATSSAWTQSSRRSPELSSGLPPSSRVVTTCGMSFCAPGPVRMRTTAGGSRRARRTGRGTCARSRSPPSAKRRTATAEWAARERAGGLLEERAAEHDALTFGSRSRFEQLHRGEEVCAQGRP